MPRGSIYDLLQPRARPVVEQPERVEQRKGFRDDRLCLLDGVALTAAGGLSIASGSVPEAARVELSEDMRGPDGFQLMACAVKAGIPVDESKPRCLDPKARRLHELIQAILLDALMMLEALPENGRFDIVLSAPLRSGEATSLLVEQIQQAVAETEYGERLGDIRHSTVGWDPHACLAVSESGGHPHVLWLCVDSLINTTDVGRLDRRGLLMKASRSAGLAPGEAAVALLMQRVSEGDDGQSTPGWWLGSAAEQEHAPRPSKTRGRNPSIVKGLLEQSWPDTADDAEAGKPSRVVVDALTLPGRAAEVAGPLTERWSDLDLNDHGISVDRWCGWPGEALTALQLLLAVASAGEGSPGEGESAVVLNVMEEHASRCMALRRRAASGNSEDAKGASVNGEGSTT